MDTVPQTVNCVDVLPRTSRHLHSHLLWTSLEPGHCHCAVCLMEPHMNISKPSVNKSNTGVSTLISHHKRRTLATLKILFFFEQENAWDFHCAEWERETHRKCVSLTRDAWDLAGLWNWVAFCDPVTRESGDPETQLTRWPCMFFSELQMSTYV